MRSKHFLSSGLVFTWQVSRLSLAGGRFACQGVNKLTQTQSWGGNEPRRLTLQTAAGLSPLTQTPPSRQASRGTTPALTGQPSPRDAQPLEATPVDSPGPRWSLANAGCPFRFLPAQAAGGRRAPDQPACSPGFSLGEHSESQAGAES